jgi:hypothetical protein
MMSLSQGQLRIQVESDESSMMLSWLGRSEERDPSATIGPFLSDVRKGILSGMNVVIDFRQLEYMNSSTVRPIVTFLKEASDASKDVRVVFDGQKSWQKLSFRALQSLAAVFRNVRFEG